MRSAAVLIALIVLGLVITEPASANVMRSDRYASHQPSLPAALQDRSFEDAVVSQASSDGSALEVTYVDGTRALLAVPNQLREAVAEVRPGDIIEGTVATDGSTTTLQYFAWKTRSVAAGERVGALLLAFGILLVLAIALTRSRPTKLFLGADNRYSTSKFQTVLWFWTLLATYVATSALRWWKLGPAFIGGIDIPLNLLALSGISVAALVGAKRITQKVIDKEGESAKPAAQAPQASNLTNDDQGRVDLGDTQMLIVTVLAVVIYLLQIFGFVGSLEYRKLVGIPDVDTTMLALFGLGQGAYLVKKLVGGLGAALTPLEEATAAGQDAAAAAERAAEAKHEAVKVSTMGAAEMWALIADIAAKQARDAAKRASTAAGSAQQRISSAGLDPSAVQAAQQQAEQTTTIAAKASTAADAAERDANEAREEANKKQQP